MHYYLLRLLTKIKRLKHSIYREFKLQQVEIKKSLKIKQLAIQFWLILYSPYFSLHYKLHNNSKANRTITRKYMKQNKLQYKDVEKQAIIARNRHELKHQSIYYLVFKHALLVLVDYLLIFLVVQAFLLNFLDSQAKYNVAENLGDLQQLSEWPIKIR